MKSSLLSKHGNLLRDLLGYAVFWGWNTLFLAFTFFGLAPLVLVGLCREVVVGFIPWDFAVVATLIMLVPLLCVGLGAAVFRSRPRRLLALFYGLEAPLLILLTLRLFLVRQLTPGVAQLLISFHVAAVFFLCQMVLDHRREHAASMQIDETQTPSHLWLAGQSIGLAASAYAGSILTFYAIPVATVALRYLWSFAWLRDLGHAIIHTPKSAFFLASIGGLFFMASATLFIAAPFAMIVLYARAWRRSARAHRTHHGVLRTAMVTASILMASATIFVLANRQPQRAVLGLLATPPSSDSERVKRLHQSEEIRRGLLNAYAAPYRYFSGVDENNHIEVLYRDTVGLGEVGGSIAQTLFNKLARPLLYDGASLSSDQEVAARQYEQFFDEPLQKREQSEMLSALSSSWSRTDREAGLLDQGARKVRLAQQDLSIDEHGPMADIEIHDRYENQTAEQQEIFYYFNLPQSAAITGLWLGDSDDRSHRFAFAVSPRGAAQEVYKRERARRRDPALVEQIGPRQYRLRVFPIPPRAIRENDATPPMHVWLTYRVFSVEGRWPLPHLAERRNAYWDGKTRYSIHGRPRPAPGEEWVGDSIAVTSPESIAANGEGEAVIDGVRVKRVSIAKLETQPPTGKRFAFVIDRSFSMGRLSGVMTQALEEASSQLGKANTLELYLTSAKSRGEAPSRLASLDGFKSDQMIYYGGQSSGELLEQFETLREGRTYDAIFILTDEGSYDLAADKHAPVETGGPLFFVHLGGRLPPGYDDGTLAAIESSGGGIATSLAEELRVIGLRASAEVVSIDGDHVWIVQKGVIAPIPRQATDPSNPWEVPAARQWILAHSKAAHAGELSELDHAHRIAHRHGIVSPLSSMIVLVDDAQREALRAAEARADRFDREVEDGKAPLIGSINPFHVQGTPEPEEWLLIALAAIGLTITWRRRGTALQTA